MAKRLTNFLNPRTLKITLADIAQGINKPVEKLYRPKKAKTDADWKWANVFLVVVEGERARFGSYRVLVCWLEAVIELLSSCTDWQTLAELIAVTEWELQHYNYPEAHQQRLQEVLKAQKERLEELKVEAIKSLKAWEWAKGWEPILSSCADEAALNIAVQLLKIQKSQYAEYQDVIDWVRELGAQHRAAIDE